MKPSVCTCPSYSNASVEVLSIIGKHLEFQRTRGLVIGVGMMFSYVLVILLKEFLFSSLASLIDK